LELHKDWAKWLVPKYMYAKEFFPQFISGSGYIMSLKAAECILQKSQVFPNIILGLKDWVFDKVFQMKFS